MVRRDDTQISQLQLSECIQHSDEEQLNPSLPYDLEIKCRSFVRIFPGEIPPLKVNRQSIEKKMEATFFPTCGHMATVGTQGHTTACLPAASKENQEATETRFEGNSAAQHHDTTLNLLKGTPVELISNSLYKQDLASCDFFIYSMVEKKLHGRKFTTPEDVVTAYQGHLVTLHDSLWPQCLQNLFRRMDWPVRCQEEYLKKVQLWEEKYLQSVMSASKLPYTPLLVKESRTISSHKALHPFHFGRANAGGVASRPACSRTSYTSVQS